VNRGIGPDQRIVAQRVDIQLPGGSYRILPVDVPVRAKQAMGRDKDRESISSSERSRSGRSAADRAVNPVVAAVQKVVTKAGGSPRHHVRVSVTAAERIWPSASQSTRRRHRPYSAQGPLKAPPGASIVPRDRGGTIMARGEPLTSGPRGAVHSRHTTMIVARMKRFAHTIATTAHNRKVLSHARFWKFRVIGARLRRRRAGPSGGKSDEVAHV